MLIKEMSAKNVVTMEEIKAAIVEIDELDGKRDGKTDLNKVRTVLGYEPVRSTPVDEDWKGYWYCNDCNHRSNIRYGSCVYCGKARKR